MVKITCVQLINNYMYFSAYHKLKTEFRNNVFSKYNLSFMYFS